MSVDLISAFLFFGGITLLLGVADVCGFELHGLHSCLPAVGASCALKVFLTTAPGAQPQGLLGSYLFAALIGLSFAHTTRSLEELLGHLLARVFAVVLIAPP
ncbi:hypothetical protein C3747_335g105c [Trypanosoma cruzi]|uniref:HPP transmembrane region domain-containing protein n=2 Tax=Trypanosoma cruzi TaxID=5693 RepID=Q4D4A8_TRYCC|nr:hypothetical protein, conserved [Trypanosoma cruzi]EAN87360.1 hypothetical protein, conserved [Trypanosoma cruzi]KAF8293503.1 hypothetical protein TcYC6_0112800 [Trypanosoma cruzi]PWU91561.1 hypothetical protein C3747_335g105c [Trypanosoma cruzi]RNC56949.1 HPP family protein [Trypanosoma cruzi]|eukprot:XP_809211.1 hypothetical protein [Trypanosoma cruzi strain CL Brener]